MSPWDARYGSVAVLARDGTPLRGAPGSLAADAGRYHRAAVSYGDGSSVVNAASLYGHTGAAQVPEVMDANELLLAAALEDLVALGDAPVLLLGDFNVSPEQSPVLWAALASGWWFDAAALCASRAGGPPEPTCFTATSSSRIDCIFCNRVSVSALRAVRVVPDAGLPTHRPVIAEFDIHAFDGEILTHRRPRALRWSARCLGQGGVISVLPRGSANRWRTALCTQDVEALWSLWCTAAETVLLGAAPQHEIAATGGSRSFCGRAQDRAPQRRRASGKPGPRWGPGCFPLRAQQALGQRTPHRCSRR